MGERCSDRLTMLVLPEYDRLAAFVLRSGGRIGTAALRAARCATGHAGPRPTPVLAGPTGSSAASTSHRLGVATLVVVLKPTSRDLLVSGQLTQLPIAAR